MWSVTLWGHYWQVNRSLSDSVSHHATHWISVVTRLIFSNGPSDQMFVCITKQPSALMPFGSPYLTFIKIFINNFFFNMHIIWKNWGKPKTWENIVLQWWVQKLQCHSLHRHTKVAQKSTPHTLPVSKTIQQKTEKQRTMKKWQKTPRWIQSYI